MWLPPTLPTAAGAPKKTAVKSMAKSPGKKAEQRASAPQPIEVEAALVKAPLEKTSKRRGRRKH